MFATLMRHSWPFRKGIDIVSIACEITISWMPQDLTDDYSEFIQAWCHQEMLTQISVTIIGASLGHKE